METWKGWDFYKVIR